MWKIVEEENVTRFRSQEKSKMITGMQKRRGTVGKVEKLIENLVL